MARTAVAAGSALMQSFRLQLRVLSALMLRELHTRFGRNNLGYLWLFIEPMILGSAIALLHYMVGHGLPGGLDILSFYVVGYTPYYLFRSILNRSCSALQANVPLFMHRQVTYLDVMLSRNLLDGAAVMMGLGVLLIVLGVVTGHWPQDVVWMALGIILMTAFCHGMSLIIVAATVWGVETVERVIHPFTYLMIPVTGAFFMVWWLPEEAQQYALMVPTVHLFEMIREGHFGPVVPFNYDLRYVVEWIVGLNALGMLALSVAKRRIEFI